MPLEEIAQYLEKIAEYLGVSAAPAAITFAVFMLLDKVASPAANRTVNAWIKREHYNQRDLKPVIVELFDHLYGSPLLTVRTFFRSAAISLLAFGVYMWFARRALHLQDITSSLSAWNLLAMFAIAVILSDFLSLFLVRRCLTLANVNLSTSVVLASVGAIIAISGIISLFGFMLGFEPFFSGYIKGIFQPSYAEVVENGGYTALFRVIIGLLKHAIANAFVVGSATFDFTISTMWFPTLQYIVSALLVYLWLPLFLLSGVIAQYLPTFFQAVGLTQWFIKRGGGHPFGAIGVVASAIMLVGAVFWQVVSYIVS